jgi:hypothetical protein
LDGLFIQKFDSRKDAAKLTDGDSNSICYAVNGKYRQSGGFQWLSEYKGQKIESVPPIKVREGLRKNLQVFQYLNGKFAQSFESCLKASEITGINLRNIVENAKGFLNTGGGFQWFFSYQGEDITPFIPQKGTKTLVAVIKLDENMNIVKRFVSCRDARREEGEIIQYYLKNKKLSSKGFYWRYESEIYS